MHPRSHVTMLSCSDLFIAFTSNDETLWRRDIRTNRLILMQKQIRISKLVCGKDHCLLIVGSFETTSRDAAEVEDKSPSISSGAIKKHSCGSKYQTPANRRGDISIDTTRCMDNRFPRLYSFGCGRRGQLGSGEFIEWTEHLNDVHIPSPQTSDNERYIYPIDICAGAEYSAVIGSDGNLYTFGYDKLAFNQGICQGEDSNVAFQGSSKPRIVIEFEGITDVCDVGLRLCACGPWHTVVVVGAHDVYGFGWNKFGQLGEKDQQVKFVLV